MYFKKDFSIIIPHRNSLHFLPKLFSSIPESDKIEVLLVDNSPVPIKVEQIREIGITRDFTLLFSEPARGAGGARNEGIEHASGKWLLFADSDDYYTSDAFDIYYEHLNSDAEIVYTGMGGVYADTGEPSDRGDKYAKLVHRFCEGEIDETTLRCTFSSPCCKMVSHELVDRCKIMYDEIRAGNDTFFSLVSGYNAKKIEAVDKITYIATVNHGSLTQHRDFEVIRARLYARLKCNHFLRTHGLQNHQGSIMFFLFEARHYSLRQQCTLWRLIIQYGQNPFIGWCNWTKTFDRVKNKNKRDSKYRV